MSEGVRVCVCVRACVCDMIPLHSTLTFTVVTNMYPSGGQAHCPTPYLSAGGSSPIDPLPVEVGLVRDSLLESSPTLPPSSPPPLDFLGDKGGGW